MGGCGCKKRQQTIQKPNVNVTVSEQNNQTTTQLVLEDEKNINKIITKIEKLTQ